MKITDEVTVHEIRQEKVSNTKNRAFWSLEEKAIRWVPYRSNEEREEHLMNTIGSFDQSMCVPNEVRFDKSGLHLLSVSFYVPEETFGDEKLDSLNSLIGNSGLDFLGWELDEARDNFIFELAQYVNYDSENDRLFGVSDFLTENLSQSTALRLSEDITLFFTNEFLSGWCLKKASQKLAFEFEYQRGDEHKSLINLYYDIYNSRNMELMDDEDDGLKYKLKTALETLKVNNAHENKCGIFLIDAIKNSLDFHYQ